MGGVKFECAMPGRPIVKKNTQRTYGRGKATRRVSTPRYMAWEKDARAACNLAFKGQLISERVVAHFKFYFANRQSEPDVSNLIEGPQDVLVKAGVIKDDRLIVRVEAEKFFGHEPRTEVVLCAYADGAA